MSELSIPSLPTPEEYYAAALRVQHRLDNRLGDLGRVFNDALENDKSLAQFYDQASGLSSYVEPMDRSTGEFVDSTHASARAFHLGSTAGILVALETHGKLITPRDIFSNIRLGGIDMDANDEAHTRHQIAEAIMQLGHRGTVLIGAQAGGRFTAWSERYVQDITKQRMFEVGAGVITTLAYEQHETALQKRARSEMEALVQSAHDIDWDAWAIEELYGEQPK